METVNVRTILRFGFLPMLLSLFASASPAARHTIEDEQRVRSAYLNDGKCMSPYNSRVSSKMGPASARRKQVYQTVLGEVRAESLGTVIPAEFRERCDGLSAEQMEVVWAEALTQLAYVESGWRSSTRGDAGGRSQGLFQMSWGTSALGKRCFGGPNGPPSDDRANARCAVRKWKEMLALNPSMYSGHQGGRANVRTRYWGPFTPSQCSVPQKGPSVFLAAHRKCQQFLRENIAGRQLASTTEIGAD